MSTHERPGSGIAPADPRPRTLRIMAALMATAMLAGGIGVLGRDGPAPQGDSPVAAEGRTGLTQGVPAKARVAIDLATQGHSLDGARRDTVVRETVLESRAVGFLQLFDALAKAVPGPQARYEPVAFRVVEKGPDDARVLVLSRVVQGGPDGQHVSWDLAGFGVIRKYSRWWVYSYLGSTQTYVPGDPELADFEALESRS